MSNERSVAVPSQQELAVERTVMAYERTLMAWLRTSLAMISVGFALRELFDFSRAEGRSSTMRPRFEQARRKRFPLTLVFAFACLLLLQPALAATVHEIGRP